MSCCCDFTSTLHYVSPAHGGWGVIRIAALVPESHQLFVSPFACGRHGALGGAINGIKDRVSYVYIDEGDIVSGGYEELIPKAVDELFEFLGKRPKVLLLFVSCLDDLLGTDHEALNRVLSEKYPDVKFRSCHMNPIKMDTKFPPGVTLQNNMYSLLERSETKDRAVNLIGNNMPLDRGCELFEIMADNGFEIRHITDFDKFDDYYNAGYIDRVITTNLTYLPPEALEKPYFVAADMSKFIALIIDAFNHDITIGNVLDPTDRIHSLLEKHRAGIPF